METQAVQSKPKNGIGRKAAQVIVPLVVIGAVMFLVAGKLGWPGGWAFLVINGLVQAVSSFLLPVKQPGLEEERSKVHPGTKGWDRFYAPAVILIGTVGLLIVAALDVRFGWSATAPLWAWVAGLAIALAAQGFVLWAMASNNFFALTVRIQSERGHQVAQSGPYGLVRHPGYAGSLVYNLAIPLVLGSWWAYIPAGLTIVLLVMRTRLEDRTLQEELPGYREYAEAVPWRLVPGVW
jgi:protein-S-isoprenylcysteine O-methyltransferase Ste14